MIQDSLNATLARDTTPLLTLPWKGGCSEALDSHNFLGSQGQRQVQRIYQENSFVAATNQR